MRQIPHALLVAGVGMYGQYIPDLTPERLQQALKQTSTPVELEPGYKPVEFCKLARISKMTLWRWEREGKIRVSRIGRVVRVPRDEAERILSGGVTAGSEGSEAK